METVKSGTWLHDLIEVYNNLGGRAAYKDVYALAKQIRVGRGASWTPEAEASIRRTVEDHAISSANFRGRSVFYSVNGHGRGVWGLMPEYLQSTKNEGQYQNPAYEEGLEGIIREQHYLVRSRDPRLVEERKVHDRYTCQVCRFRLEVESGKFIIDVHHLKPLGQMVGVNITSIEELVCLCPTCHRIAHSRPSGPFSPQEVKVLRKKL
jgi:predicted HNH restriction endonuclease